MKEVENRRKIKEILRLNKRERRRKQEKEIVIGIEKSQKIKKVLGVTSEKEGGK